MTRKPTKAKVQDIASDEGLATITPSLDAPIVETELKVRVRAGTIGFRRGGIRFDDANWHELGLEKTPETAAKIVAWVNDKNISLQVFDGSDWQNVDATPEQIQEFLEAVNMLPPEK